jgi:hypothetical protein
MLLFVVVVVVVVVVVICTIGFYEIYPKAKSKKTSLFFFSKYTAVRKLAFILFIWAKKKYLLPILNRQLPHSN